MHLHNNTVQLHVWTSCHVSSGQSVMSSWSDLLVFDKLTFPASARADPGSCSTRLIRGFPHAHARRWGSRWSHACRHADSNTVWPRPFTVTRIQTPACCRVARSRAGAVIWDLRYSGVRRLRRKGLSSLPKSSIQSMQYLKLHSGQKHGESISRSHLIGKRWLKLSRYCRNLSMIDRTADTPHEAK